MYYLEAGREKHRRMRNALLLACAAHILAVVVISFDFDASPGYSAQIEVTLATRPSLVAPEDARHIAQSSQEGTGPETETVAQAPAPRQAPRPDPASDSTADADLLTTAAEAPRSVREDTSEYVPRPRLIPEIDPVQAPDPQTSVLPDRVRVRRLSSVATRESADAAYLHSFLKRLEAVGNRYYPEASIRYGLYGSLRLLVAVGRDGALEDIRVLESSGFAVLDEAAIKTVRMAAPFAPFPPELAATTDRLEIIRTWHFEKNELSSNKAQAN